MDLQVATISPRVRRARLAEAAEAAFLLRVAFAEVAALYTPEARGQGVGRALLEAVERFARDRGHERLFLRTTPFLTSAIALYSRSGFTMREDAERDFHGVPLFEMEKLVELDGVERP